MKKFIAVLLAVIMVVSIAMIPASASEKTQENVTVSDMESVFADGENSLIVFVTGIGQSYSYRFDESYTKEGAFEKGTLQDYENYAPLIAEGKYQTRWNLFNAMDEAFSDTSTITSIIKVVKDLIASSVTKKCTIKAEDVNTIIRNLFKFNIVDEEGNSNPRVVTPRYAVPVSQYPWAMGEDGEMRSEARERFFSSIPCEDIAKEKFGENYEDYLYCFNYCAFSYTSKNVQGLHEFIETILANNKVGAKDVVLVPMSMGASITTAYIDAYPTKAENHIKRVIGIVGAWDGTEIIADMLTKSYCEPMSADLFYNGIIGDLIGEPWGYLVNVALRVAPKQVLRDFIDLALGALATEIFGTTPSLSNMAPLARYEEVMATGFIKSDVVRKEVDDFYAAKARLHKNIANLQAEGVTFSFIAGYGLPFGACTSDYSFFGFMKSSPTTNSDEIINIDSTAPGTSFVPYGTKFQDTEGRQLSPDGSLDISTCYYKDSTWYFFEQKHELEHNNTALSLALNLATGHVTTVDSCDDPDGEYYYPQFNAARNLKRLKWYKEDLQNYCEETGYVLTAEQEAILAEADAMTMNTVNNVENDEAVMDKVNAMLVEIGVYEAEAEPSFFDNALNVALKGLNDVVYLVFGAKGFADFKIL
jgi:pimeloyl-ACP methyl ester carboxylesterase